MNIRVFTETLTDGSQVCDMRVGDRTFHATTRDDGLAFAHAVADAINEFTTDTAHVVVDGEHVP